MRATRSTESDEHRSNGPGEGAAATATHPIPRPRRPPDSTASDVPGRHRVARLVWAGSPQWVLLQVMREVLDPTWAPAPSATRLVQDLRDLPDLPDLQALRAARAARARLRRASQDRITLSQMRALATLNLAINHLDDHLDLDLEDGVDLVPADRPAPGAEGRDTSHHIRGNGP